MYRLMLLGDEEYDVFAINLQGGFGYNYFLEGRPRSFGDRLSCEQSRRKARGTGGRRGQHAVAPCIGQLVHTAVAPVPPGELAMSVGRAYGQLAIASACGTAVAIVILQFVMPHLATRGFHDLRT